MSFFHPIDVGYPKAVCYKIDFAINIDSDIFYNEIIARKSAEMAKHFSQSRLAKIAATKTDNHYSRLFLLEEEKARGLFSDLFFIAQHLPAIVFSQAT